MNSLTDALISAGMQKRFWTSCYKASSHTQSKFWSQCGGKGPTITIVRYKQYIFAAYSDRDWIDTGNPIEQSLCITFYYRFDRSRELQMVCSGALRCKAIWLQIMVCSCAITVILRWLTFMLSQQL